MLTRCLGCMKPYESTFGLCPYCGYMPGTPAEEAIHMAPGTLLQNRYVIGKVLGFGGFGVTYIAWDNKLEQRVAIKEYLPVNSPPACLDTRRCRFLAAIRRSSLRTACINSWRKRAAWLSSRTSRGS